jgi:tetratricopeptide (TPR) repeat protein
LPAGALSVTIAHEIAHCFGCFHVESRSSIMVPKLGRRLPRSFDAANARVLQVCRNAVLARGEEGVSEEALMEVARLAHEFGVASEHNNAAYQLAQRAYRVMRDSEDLETGVRLSRVALSFEPQLASARANLAYALATQGRPAEAERELGIALRDNPELLTNSTVRDLSHQLGLLPAGG